jgi:hypothetical protein
VGIDVDARRQLADLVRQLISGELIRYLRWIPSIGQRLAAEDEEGIWSLWPFFERREWEEATTE